MAEYSGGVVTLAVRPVFSDLQKKVTKQFTEAGVDARKGFDKGFGSGPTPVPAPSPTESRRKGADAGGAFADGFRAKVEAALRALPPVKLGIAKDAAEQELRDLRGDLESLSGKTVGVDVTSAQALAEVERISTRLRTLAADSADVQVKADTAGALAALEAVATAAKLLDGSEPRVEVKSNVGAFATDFRRRIEAATTALPTVTIGVASSAAEQELRDLRVELESLADKTVGVDIDAGAALAEVERISERLRELGASSADVQVKADTLAALTSLEAVAAAARALNGQDVDIDVKVDTSGAEANLNSFTGRLIALTTIIAGLGPALLPIGAVATGALAGIGTGAVAAGAGIGTLLVGLSGVGEAVKALGKAQESQGKTAAAAGASAAAQARQVATAQRGLEAAEASLANTRANAAAAAEASAKKITDARQNLADVQADVARRVEQAQTRVADVAEESSRRVESARRSLADAEERGAEQIRSALERQERAERSLAEAQDDARSAQEDLNEARKTAADRLQDLSLDVAGAALRQRQAVLDLAEAQETLAKVTKDPKSSKRDIAEAQLGYEQAQQSLTEIGVRFARLQQEKAAADAAGVEGSDAVVEAQKRIKDSAQGVLDAQKQVGAAIGGTTTAVMDAAERSGEAQENLTRVTTQAGRDQSDAAAALALAQQDGARKVTDAQAGIVEAQAAAAEQQRQSAFSVEQAVRSVVGAQEAVAAASEKTGSSSSAAVDNVAAAMAGLSPAGQAFALFLFSLRPAIDGIRAAAAQDLLPGLTTAIQTLLPALPAFNAFLTTMGGVMGDLAVQAASALTGPEWAPFFEMIARTGGPTLELFAQAGGNLILALANLLVAFEPLSTAFAEGFADMMARFVEFTANLGSNEGFQSFLDYLVSSGPLVREFFGALFGAIGNIITAMAPFGQVILGVVTGLLSFIAAVPPAVIEAVVLAIVGIVAAFNILGPVIAFVSGIISAVTAGMPILGAVIAALGGPVTLIIVGIIALGAALVAAYHHSETFRDIVNGVFDAVGAAGTFLWENVLKPAFEGIGAVIKFVWDNVLVPIFEAYKWYFENVLGPVVLWLWHNVIEPAWTGIRLAIDVAWALIKVALGAFEVFVRAVLAPVFTWLYDNVIKPVWDSVGTKISDVWNNIVKPALEALGNYIRDTVAPAFQKGVDAIGAAWEGIKEAAKAPVRFVVEKVINDGIIDTFNDVASKFPGVDKVPRVKLPEGFARGGVLPGTSSWQAGDDQLVPMRRGEGVAISEAMSVPALRNELLRWNAIGVRGGRGALSAYAGRSGYAKGGIIGSLSGLFSSASTKAGDIFASVKQLASDPAGAITSVVRRILELLPGAETLMGQVATALPTGLLDGIKDTVAGMTSQIGEGVGTALAPLSGAATPSSAGLVALGRQLQAMGFRVSEHAAFGGVNPVHMKGSKHYVGRAFDLNAGPGGENAIEKRAIDSVASMIRAAGFQLIWRAPGHFDHGHVAYDSGGYLQPGYTQVFNGTGKPEPVLTAGDYDALRGAALGRGGGRQGPVIEQHNTIAREVDWEVLQRRQEFQVASMVGL